MRWTRHAKVRVPLTEYMIRTQVCKRLRAALGNVYTIKAGQICGEITGDDRASAACKVAVRRYLLAVLNEAIVRELSNKYRIVVDVKKARELLDCEHED